MKFQTFENFKYTSKMSISKIFKDLDKIYDKPYNGLYYKQLFETIKQEFLNYGFSFEEKIKNTHIKYYKINGVAVSLSSKKYISILYDDYFSDEEKKNISNKSKFTTVKEIVDFFNEHLPLRTKNLQSLHEIGLLDD